MLRGRSIASALVLALTLARCGGRVAESTSDDGKGSTGGSGLSPENGGSDAGEPDGPSSSSSGGSRSFGSGAPSGGSDSSPAGSAIGSSGGASDGSSNSPSCQPGGAGLTRCGASQESCCTSLGVAGGTYNRTYTNSGSGPTGEADPASVSGFRLDKYLVTVGRFRQFVNVWNGGAGWTPPAGSGKHTHLNAGKGLNAAGGGYEPGWVSSDSSYIAPTNSNLACHSATWTASAGSQEKLPINCVRWFEAYAFCIWDGGFLPSEAEWEYAAAGGNQQREYPWGSIEPGTMNQYAIYGDGSGNCFYPSGTLAACTGVSNIAPVGTATQGAGLWGQLDLAGDVNQWNLDWRSTYVDPCTDCVYLTPGSRGRVGRGGDFYFKATDLLASFRTGSQTPSYRNDNIGFRCARTP